MADFVDLTEEEWETIEGQMHGTLSQQDAAANESTADIVPIDPRVALELEDEKEDIDARLQAIAGVTAFPTASYITKNFCTLLHPY